MKSEVGMRKLEKTEKKADDRSQRTVDREQRSLNSECGLRNLGDWELAYSTKKLFIQSTKLINVSLTRSFWDKKRSNEKWQLK